MARYAKAGCHERTRGGRYVRKKLRLDVGELAVASFRTADWRADIAATEYSRDYTHNANCWTTL